MLLCPRGPLYRHRGGIWKKTTRYAPLTLTTLASLIPPEIPADVTLLDEGVDEIDASTLEADLVGIRECEYATRSSRTTLLYTQA